jgi:DNA mismatch repair protein MutS
MSNANLTPVMKQHADAKGKYPDAVIFFRLGDFYEMFGEDAILCARVLNLTLTSRNKGKSDEIPMAGVPHHAAHAYLAKMLDAGYRVALCEQMADPKTVKGIVPREVVRVLTPGLITDGDYLEPRRNNFVAALELGSKPAVALLDISTGELRSATLSDTSVLLAELHHAAPKEVLIASEPDAAGDLATEHIRAAVGAASVILDGALDAAAVEAALGELASDAKALPSNEVTAVARVLRYARRCNPLTALPVEMIGRWDPSASMVLEPAAVRHLELVHSNTGDTATTLLSVLDETQTAAGARLLRRRLLAPLTGVAEIRRRLDQVEVLVTHAALRVQLCKELQEVSDFERLLARVELGEGSPKDLGAIRDSLLAASKAAALIALLPVSEREALQASEAPDVVSELAHTLSQALVERPPGLAKEGAIFLPQFDATLREFDDVRQNGSALIDKLEARLREETAISSLKIKYTRVFGWYIEVTKSSLGKVPKLWRRKQTVAAGERFTLDELDTLAEKIAHADDCHRQRELELLKQLNAQAHAAAGRIRRLSTLLACWDVASALAEVAHRYDYQRPVVDDSTTLDIRDGRHPVVERLAASGQFVPNDVSIDAATQRLWLITGPNMAGKSTFLRQVALISIMAQMGSFVPAASARIGVVDRVLSRVGASDNLARGDSTFMVEMRETAWILRSATERSLVILDEIGRGTSTFDGLAIAWAVAEHLEEVTRCRALFATHYHELTDLGEQSEHTVNHSVSAREHEGEIVFLHRVVAGSASRSYGVAVAKLAGLPEAVLARARAILAGLEGGVVEETAPRRKPRRRPASRQLDLFGAVAAPEHNTSEREVLDTIRAVDVERLAPLDALGLLAKLKRRLA